MNKPVHVDVCSGLGMLGVAAHHSGFETKAFCEINLYCQKVLARHFPGVYIHGDLKTLTAILFREYGIEFISLFSGGFPCQDLSCAGKGAGLSGARSGLWFEMLRLIEETQPLFVVIENVPALKTRGADLVLAGLEAAGYTSEAFVVGAWAAGAPHERERVWIVAYSRSVSDAQADSGACAFGSGRFSRNNDGGGSGRSVPGIDRAISQPRMGGGYDGDAARLVGVRWPAAPGAISRHGQPAVAAAKGPNHDERMTAIGNAIVWPVAAAIFDTIREAL